MGYKIRFAPDIIEAVSDYDGQVFTPLWTSWWILFILKTTSMLVLLFSDNTLFLDTLSEEIEDWFSGALQLANFGVIKV